MAKKKATKKATKKVVVEAVEETVEEVVEMPKGNKIEHLDRIFKERIYILASGSTEQMAKFNKRMDYAKAQIKELL